MTDHATMDWRHNAACRALDGELWFPTGEDADTSLPRRVCIDCPVRWECGATALQSGETEGIWAGYWMQQTKERDALGKALPEVAAELKPATCIECGVKYRPKGADTGRCNPCVRGMVLAEPVRAHVRRLHDWLTYRQIAAMAKIAEGTLFNFMVGGGQHMTRETAEALMSIPSLAVMQ